MKVIIIEGPAGSGKTIIAGKIADKEGTIIYDPLPGVKVRDHKGPELSFQRDMMHIYRMVTDKDHETLILDRFWLSALVYDSLRQQGYFGSAILQSHMGYLSEIINSIKSDFYMRGFPTNVHLDLEFIFNLPPVEEILERREKSSKSYPFDAAAELTLYSKMLYELKYIHPSMMASRNFKVSEWKEG